MRGMVNLVEINQILVSGDDYQEMAGFLQKAKLKQEFRFVAEDQLTGDDFLWADAYVNFKPTDKFQFGNLKWVHSIGAGIDYFLFNREWNEKVLLTRTICSFGERISQYCLSYILKELQQHQFYKQQKQAKQWTPHEPKLLSTQTVLIYGTGEIGQEIARVLSFFGANVFGVSKSGRQKEFFKQTAAIEHESALIEKADWILNTMPLTKDTYQLFNSEFFEKINGASFINIGRGLSVDESALLEALESGSLTEAVLDVFDEEPLPGQSPLWDHPRVAITPHISAVTTPEEAVKCFLETLQKVEKAEKCPNEVDIKRGY
jgi:D-2-hydroxyacid dehydrogenase (NADP+)